MNDDDPQTVDRMLLYLYMLDYPDDDVPNVLAEHVSMDCSATPHLQREISWTTEEETDSITTSEPSERAAPRDPRMMNNALVYAIAEKYDIPELKELAKRKFQTLASSKWPHDDFYAVTEAVFSTTPDGDMGLRQVVLDVCERHFQEILKDRDTRASFLENKAITAVVLDASVRMIEQDKMSLDGALAKQISLKDELSKAKADTKEALDQKSAWVSQLDHLFTRANKIEGCRHCHEKFQWCLDRVTNSSYSFHELGIQLRCTNCRTKALS